MKKKTKLTWKDFIPGTSILLILFLIGALVIYFEYPPFLLIPIWIFVLSIGFAFAATGIGIVLFTIYLLYVFNYVYLLIKKKNTKTMNWILGISTFVVFILFIIGLIIVVSHP